MEIRCSSFPPPRQLIYSSPVSASFHPSSSMFSILTAFLSLFSPYVLSSVFVHIHPTHTPFASSSPGSASHLPPSMCSMSVCAYFCPPSSVFAVFTSPPFSPHLQAVDFPHLLSAFIILTPSFASSPENLCFSPPRYMFVILTTPLALLVSR